MSGGSAIYTDPGQLIYSLIISADKYRNPHGTIPLLCRGVVVALEILGVRAEYKPVNDILVDGRKIRQRPDQESGVVLQHGTLLVDTDFDLMFRLLKAQKDKRWRARSMITS